MIGIDTVRISRIENALKGEAFKSRVFTEREISYCESRPRPIESYAGIFCAKEAAAKAIKTGFGRGIMPLDIEIARDGNGAPRLLAHGNAANAFIKYDTHVSISHDGDYAVAAVMLVDRSEKV